MIDLRLGDCLELMRELPDASVDVSTMTPLFDMNTGAAQCG